jgi:3D (Asp-Asp-Asp) domain-containing protein
MNKRIPTMGATQSIDKNNKLNATERSNSAATNATSEATSEGTTNDVYPIPKGDEYDAIDKIAAELPNVIDDESRQQVEDYKQACDNGKGPMVRTPAPINLG